MEGIFCHKNEDCPCANPSKLIFLFQIDMMFISERLKYKQLQGFINIEIGSCNVLFTSKPIFVAPPWSYHYSMPCQYTHLKKLDQFLICIIHFTNINI